MKEIRWTRFWLRIVGIALLLYRATDIWSWAWPLVFEGLKGNWPFVRNMYLAPLQNWGVNWPSRVEWLFLVAVGLVLLFRNAWLATLLWKDLERHGCSRCGYDRRGLGPAAPCPECGTSPSM